jgi:hypothetical protein
VLCSRSHTKLLSERMASQGCLSGSWRKIPTTRNNTSRTVKSGQDAARQDKRRKMPSAQDRANSRATSSQIPNTGIAMSSIYSGMGDAARPRNSRHTVCRVNGSHVHTIILLLSAILMSAHQWFHACSRGPSREMGLKVSHDRCCCIVNLFQLAYCSWFCVESCAK